MGNKTSVNFLKKKYWIDYKENVCKFEQTHYRLIIDLHLVTFSVWVKVHKEDITYCAERKHMDKGRLWRSGFLSGF